MEKKSKVKNEMEAYCDQQCEKTSKTWPIKEKNKGIAITNLTFFMRYSKSDKNPD